MMTKTNATYATLVYDGDCGICRQWVDYWQRLTNGRVVYRPYQDSGADFPTLTTDDFKHAIQLIEPDGQVYSGAAATYRILRYAPGRRIWWWMYTRVPGFARASETAYAFFARRRDLLSRLTRLLWGRTLEPERTTVVSWVFLRLIGAIYVAAFASLGVQILGLVGREGILPLGEYLDAARQGLGHSAYWYLPTLFWFGASDTALVAGTMLGVALGLLVVVGIWVRAALIGLFVLYLSYTYAGQVFMSFQWDLLLLESGFLAIFLIGGSRVVVWLYRWLLFRYLFLAGAVKLLSGDPNWRDLSALDYHFWTQPLPTPLAWYAAQFPHWLLASGTAATLFVELVVGFLIFLPRRPRAFSAWCILLFQFLIVLTGNYNFFNLLTMALCVFLLDDAALSKVLPARVASWAQEQTPVPGRTATLVTALLALIIVPVGLNTIWQPFTFTNLPIAGTLAEAVSPLLIVNSYGLFAVMTTTRPEIIVEGSDDGQTWREYTFRFKPGPTMRGPSWNIPHQPRLDWQMWFAAYGTFSENRWFERLMKGLLEARPSVLALLAPDPSRRHPPKYVRAQLYDYQFSDPSTRAQTGQWWMRRPQGIYFPQVSLANFEVSLPALQESH